MTQYLSQALAAKGKPGARATISRLMEAAITAGCLEEAHQIGVDCGDYVSDDLVQKLAQAYIATTAKPGRPE